MTAVIVALAEPAASAIAEELRDHDLRIVAVCGPHELDEAVLAEADAVLVPAERAALTHAFVTACDRARVRIVPVGGDETRLLSRLGLPAPLEVTAPVSALVAALTRSGHEAAEVSVAARRVIAVWGPHGAPGRSTVAIGLAAELASRGRSVALVDADTHAPALALLLGLGDDAPGVAAACRRAERGELDVAELSRLSVSVPVPGGRVDVLGGLNRPSRWPELSADRLRPMFEACREWVDDTVVDTAASLDSDEEVSFDLDAPRRNAATLAALCAADAIVAVVSAEPLGIARFLHAHADLRGLVGATPVTVVVNRVRPGPIGIDPRGQLRRTLERFAGIRDIHFLPDERRATDAALLHAAPLVDVVPRSPLAIALRRVSTALQAGAAAPATETPVPRKRLLARR